MGAVPEDFKIKVWQELAEARNRCYELIQESGPVIVPKKHRKKKPRPVRVCAGCGCPKSEKTPKCRTCYNRHLYHERVNGIFRERTCKGCGCNVAENTAGCVTCAQRTRHRDWINGIRYDRKCVRCGIDLDLETKGCRVCHKRHHQRNKRKALTLTT